MINILEELLKGRGKSSKMNKLENSSLELNRKKKDKKKEYGLQLGIYLLLDVGAKKNDLLLNIVNN